MVTSLLDTLLFSRTYAQVTEESNHRGTEDTERSLSGGFRRSFALSVAPWAKTRSKRSHAAGFTLRYPLAQPAAAKSSVGGEKSERRRPAIRTSGFPAVGNFSRQASELREE
jgi:hypothetical protein